MATYPTFTQLEGTKVVGDDGVVLLRSESGKPHIRSFYTSTARVVEIVHHLNQTDVDTLISFYDTNKLITFDFIFEGDGLIYTCYFTAYPSLVPSGGGYYDVKVLAVEA